jgi:hypothetical protein
MSDHDDAQYAEAVEAINKPNDALWSRLRHIHFLIRLVAVWVGLTVILVVLGIAGYVRLSGAQHRISRLTVSARAACEATNAGRANVVAVFTKLIRERNALQSQAKTDEQIAYVQQKFAPRDCSKAVP